MIRGSEYLDDKVVLFLATVLKVTLSAKTFPTAAWLAGCQSRADGGPSKEQHTN